MGKLLKLTVEVKGILEYEVQSQTSAKELAAKYAKEYPGESIFISFFRASDGQTGYLNPDGNYSITGQSWVNDN